MRTLLNTSTKFFFYQGYMVLKTVKYKLLLAAKLRLNHPQYACCPEGEKNRTHSHNHHLFFVAFLCYKNQTVPVFKKNEKSF